jgi:hypothetical protein
MYRFASDNPRSLSSLSGEQLFVDRSLRESASEVDRLTKRAIASCNVARDLRLR